MRHWPGLQSLELMPMDLPPDRDVEVSEDRRRMQYARERALDDEADYWRYREDE